MSQTFLRIEHKYLITKEQMETFLETVNEHIKPDIYPEYDLNNIYLDTDNYDIIRSCSDDNHYKEKLRVRSYGNPEDNSHIFVEIKKKYQGLGEKRRTEIEYHNLSQYLAHPPGNSQIEKELAYSLTRQAINPKMFISYHRKAFDGIEEDDLRITFDTEIKYRENSINLCGDESMDKELVFGSDKNIILEIKLAERYPLWLVKALAEIKAYRSSFSKYGTLYKNKIRQEQLKSSFITKTANEFNTQNSGELLYQGI